MQMTAVYSCVRILAEAVAGLPLNLFHYLPDGGKEKSFDHPLYRLLHDEPNPEMSSFVFRETLMTHLLLWGNAYAQIIRNGKGEVVALYLHPFGFWNKRHISNGRKQLFVSMAAHRQHGQLCSLFSLPDRVLLGYEREISRQ